MPLLTLSIVEAHSLPPRNRVIRVGLGGRPFPFCAGQHVLLGEHGRGARRPYSIASAPIHAGRDDALEFLIQVDESGSPGPHLPDLSAGRLLDVEGPYGDFVVPDAPRPRHVLFVGGGTGIAPIRSMMWQLLETNPAVGVGLLYSGRTPEDLVYSDEFRQLARDRRIELREAVTREAPDSWAGRRSRIGRDDLEGIMTGEETLCFVCGPDSLVEDVPRLLVSLGVPSHRVRTEQWHEQP